jgi:hypothetical protein
VENLDAEEDISRAWESIRRNIKIPDKKELRIRNEVTCYDSTKHVQNY